MNVGRSTRSSKDKDCMKHARILLDGEFVTAAPPDLIVTVVGAMRHDKDYTPHAGRLQPEESGVIGM